MTNMTEEQGGVKRFTYSQKVLAELESTLSPERLSTYVRAVPEHDKEQAIRLREVRSAPPIRKALDKPDG